MKRSKLGISVLKDNDDLYEIFTGEKSKIEKSQEEAEDNFSELFEESLSETNNFQSIFKVIGFSLAIKIFYIALFTLKKSNIGLF